MKCQQYGGLSKISTMTTLVDIPTWVGAPPDPDLQVINGS